MTNTWKISPDTLDYSLDATGSPVEDDLITAAYIRLRAPRANWMYAPDLSYGSDFFKSHVRISEVATLEDMAKRALQPLIDDGRAQDITVTTTVAKRGAIQMIIKITDTRGTPQILVFTPIGR